MTDWIEILRAECERTSQGKVAKRLRDASGNGYPSDPLVSRLLSGTYPGEPERLRDLVEGLFGGAHVTCPVLGELRRDACSRHQNAQFASTNPTRVALYRACRGGCPNSHLEQAQ